MFTSAFQNSQKFQRCSRKRRLSIPDKDAMNIPSQFVQVKSILKCKNGKSFDQMWNFIYNHKQFSIESRMFTEMYTKNVHNNSHIAMPTSRLQNARTPVYCTLCEFQLVVGSITVCFIFSLRRNSNCKHFIDYIVVFFTLNASNEHFVALIYAQSHIFQ